MQDREVPVLSTLSDLSTPWCLHVVATLRIADHIAAGVDEINSLASAAGCDSDSLGRVLRHLVGKGVFLGKEPGRFALNNVACELLNPSQRLALDLGGIGGRMAYGMGAPFSTQFVQASPLTKSFSGGRSGKTWKPIRILQQVSTPSWGLKDTALPIRKS